VPPTEIFPPGSVSILYTGAYHACAQLNSSGGTPPVVCWGRNLFGEVGVADASIVAPPVTLPISDFDRMTLGAFETCVVRTQTPFGECIGENEYGELGRGVPNGSDASGIDTLSHPTPAAVQIGNLGDYGNFPHATGYHEGVTFTNGTVAMWGDNSLGQLGPQVDASVTSTPTLMTTINDVQTLALLQYSSCALRTDGTILCWGSTASGQNGNTATLGPVQAVPTPITGVTTATGITSGLTHACALLADGTVACWGDNTSFQLGRSTTAGYSATPGLVLF
jgi:alpha-tubulin suppressor-like RCC1 family protein